MRKALRWLLTLVVLIGTVGTAGAATAAEPEARGTGATADIKDQLLAVPGMSLIEEKPYTGYRFFVLDYTQPVEDVGRYKYRAGPVRVHAGQRKVWIKAAVGRGKYDTEGFIRL